MHLSKGPGEHKTPAPEGGEANEGVSDDADGEEEGEQQTHDPVGRAQHELRHGQPRRGVCGVEKAGGDGALAHLASVKAADGHPPELAVVVDEPDAAVAGAGVAQRPVHLGG